MQFHLIVELWRHKFSFYSELHFLPFKNWFISIITFNVTRLIRDLYLSFTLQEIEKNFSTQLTLHETQTQTLSFLDEKKRANKFSPGFWVYPQQAINLSISWLCLIEDSPHGMEFLFGQNISKVLPIQSFIMS